MVRDYRALADLIADNERTPFVWGGWDCATFAGAAIKAQTGDDALGRFAGKWSTEAGAARVLIKAGGMEAAVSTVLTPIAPSMAQRGDVAGVETLQGLLLMVVEGSTLVGPGDAGLVREPRVAMTKAWSAA